MCDLEFAIRGELPGVVVAIESGVDYSSEPTTLVVFTLEELEGGTLLKVVESGFDSIPHTPTGRRITSS